MMTKNPEEIVAIGGAMLAELNPARMALRAVGEAYYAALQAREVRERMRMEMEDARRRAIDLQQEHERQMKHTECD